jgi:hypothetical protein
MSVFRERLYAHPVEYCEIELNKQDETLCTGKTCLSAEENCGFSEHDEELLGSEN